MKVAVAESTSSPPSGDELNRLLHRVAIGDRAAFGALYDGLERAVFGTVLRVLRDPTMSEEVTQEVFVEMWQKSSEWDGTRGTATTWALMLAHRRAVDRVRSEQAMRDRHERSPMWSVRPSDATVDEVMLRSETSDVRAQLETLTDLQREAIDLAYYEGMTYREVAESLDVPLGTVKTRMRDGLMRLRKAMGGDGS